MFEKKIRKIYNPLSLFFLYFQVDLEMATKRKRVRCIESDDEEDSQGNIKDYIREATQNSTRNVVQSMAPKIDTIANEIKYEIHVSRDDTQYMHKKHHDQARMLAILNEKLEKEQSRNLSLNEDIKTLQDNALGDCAGMFDQVNSRLRTVIDEQREIKKNMKSMKEDIKTMKNDVKEDIETIKSLLETLIKHK